MAVDEIATEIGQNLDFLETDLQDVPQRQRSMRTVFDHSWIPLSEREREVMQAWSVFRGGRTREAAQRVGGASLRQLMGLVSKLLLSRAEGLRTWARVLNRQSVFKPLLGHTETAGQAPRQSLAVLERPKLSGQETRPENAFDLHEMGHVVIDDDKKEAK